MTRKKIGDILGKGYVDEVSGERESGNVHGPGEGRVGPATSTAAANPAARREASLNQMADDWAHIAHERLYRIRVLEARIAQLEASR